MLKRMLFTALAAAAVSTSALVAPAMLSPAAAQGINTFGTPPPAPVYEVVPAPRAGYVWAPGYYRWDGDRHVWTGPLDAAAGGLSLGARHVGSHVARPERLAYHRRPLGPQRQRRSRPLRASACDRDHDGVPNDATTTIRTTLSPLDGSD